MNISFCIITIIEWVIAFICAFIIGKAIIYSIFKKDYLESIGLILIDLFIIHLLCR